MKSQRNQLIILVLLIVIWAVSWHLTMNKNKAPPPAAVAEAKAAKAVSQDSLLRTRFHKIRSEMDALYHYRIKPAPFDAQWNPFRMPAMMLGSKGEKGLPAQTSTSNAKPGEQSEQGPAVLETGDALLTRAIAVLRIGGVVTMNGTTELTVDGQLHKEGESFTTRVHGRPVLLRIKQLSTNSVTLALDDPNDGAAEIRVRLK